MAGATLTKDEAIESLGVLQERALAMVRGEMSVLAEVVVGEVVGSWPVDSGDSLAAWGSTSTPQGASVFNDASYASFVGDGLADELVTVSLDGNESDTVSRIIAELNPIFDGFF